MLRTQLSHQVPLQRDFLYFQAVKSSGLADDARDEGIVDGAYCSIHTSAFWNAGDGALRVTTLQSNAV